MASLVYPFVGPLVINCLLTIGVCYYMIKSSVYRSPITYFSFLATLSALLGSIFNAAVYMDWSRYYTLRSAMSILSVISTSSLFVPGLIGFHRISKQKDNKAGVYISVVGYLWAFVLSLMVIVVYAMFEIQGSIDSYYVRYVLAYGHCGLAFLVVVLCLMTHQYLHGKAKKSLIAYTSLFIIFEIFFFIVSFAVRSGVAYYGLTLVFIDFATALAVLISVMYGHLWTAMDDLSETDSHEKLEVGSSQA
ncbi:uncharacterized protein EV154DRAFT_497698 [Mucor mucedo]|uniref:uncharacterized protein n=1 Tax=Mucor mucedo TaxID=29922 RepID=UPI00221F92EF|nr:uncharacterized protein EV154DRAFT_497698 [Mucor mucedo]KAI7894726.1 hypothetical protein EV154DRAFT_497698 [Mucor mucedo]